MTLLEFEELCNYWAEHPPVHLMVAAYLGVGDKSDSNKTDSQRSAPTQSDEMQFPIQLLGLPGLAPARPFSAEFGPDALGEIRALWQRYEAAKAAG